MLFFYNNFSLIYYDKLINPAKAPEIGNFKGFYGRFQFLSLSPGRKKAIVGWNFGLKPCLLQNIIII